MAREATISQEQVNAVADSIRGGGSKPTARAVREALGGGSMATVLKFLQVWQSGQVRATESPVVLPAGLQRVLVDFIGQEVSGAKLELQDDLIAAQQANGDLIVECERQTSTIGIQAESLEVAQAEKAELAGRLAQLESALEKAVDDATSERQAAEHARTELAKAQLRLEALPRIESEIERLRAELAQERAAKVASEQVAAVAVARLEGVIEKANKAEALAEKADNNTEKVAGELSSLRVTWQAQQTALEVATRECEGLRLRVSEAMAEAKHSSEEAAELRGQLSAAAGNKAI